MKFINLFKKFNSIEYLCDKYNIKDYTINNGLVDVDGDVNLQAHKFKELPIQFGSVYGSFKCGYNKLTTLKGSPINCMDFSFSQNEVTSLKYSPEKVNGNFEGYNNLVESLEFMPNISKSVILSNNSISSLKGCIKNVNGDFWLNDNNLTNLKYFPNVSGEIIIYNNPFPEEINDLPKYIEKIVKLQDEYGIWNINGTLNKNRFKLLKNELFS